MNMQLAIDNRQVTEFTNLTLTRSLYSLCGQFDFLIESPKYENLISYGKKVQVYVKDTLMMTGVVEVIRPSEDSDSYSLQVGGRDLTRNIVKSSAVTKNQELLNTSFKSLVTKLVKDKVIFNTSRDKTYKKISLNNQSVFTILRTYAEKLGLLMTTNPDGVILIEDLGTNSVKRKLVYGQDFYRYNLDINLSERYSKYIVKGKNSKTHTQVFGEALDSVPNDGSVLVINKTNISAEDAQNTARFQAALRASQSFSASITINGFKDVFQLNDTVYLDIPQRGVRSEMLVNDFTYDFASNSLNLGFVLPDVYKLIPEITSGGIEI